MPKPRAKTEYHCATCGKTFWKHDNPYHDNKYCSRACSAVAHTRNSTITLTCKNCGKEFTLLRHEADSRHGHERGFCSKQCFQEHNRGENHPGWQGGISRDQKAWVKFYKAYGKENYKERLKNFIATGVMPDMSKPRKHPARRVIIENQREFIMELYNNCALEEKEKILEVANELCDGIRNLFGNRTGGRGFSTEGAIEVLGAIALLLAKMELAEGVHYESVIDHHG